MNQKIENLLNVSMEVDEEIRIKSNDLSAGYDDTNKSWETIIKYNGNLKDILKDYDDVTYKELLNGYAIVRATKNVIESMANSNRVIYIEQSKQMYFQLYSAKAAACVNKMSIFSYMNQEDFLDKNNLSGMGVLTAIIDTGVDIYDDEFIDTDGKSRIIYYYDQIEEREYKRDELNEIIKSKSKEFTDISFHGTQVADIACGNSGVAFNSDIIIVKMGYSYNNSFPRTAQLMEAVDYCIRKSSILNRPIAINISFGNNYGDHKGNTILEQYLDDAISICKCCICVGSGNEGDGRTHFATKLKRNEVTDVEITVGLYEYSLDIQIWKKYQDSIRVEIIDPFGVNLGSIKENARLVESTSYNTSITAIYGMPSPFNSNQEVFITLTGRDSNYVDAGTWIIRVIPEDIIDGDINMWLPSKTALNEATGFIRATPEGTFTVPSTASRVISVGAYDSRIAGYAAFSGRGDEKRVKPDIVAPGVDIVLPVGFGENAFSRSVVTGTSFSTPFVTGVAALMMEWGIVRGNDVFLYADKLKAYLIKGANRSIFGEVPSVLYGWGALCGYNSLP